jgi:hypothetical protein
MEEIQFNELNDLRKLYKKRKEDKIGKQRAIQNIRDGLQPTVKKLREDLELQRIHLLKDKEFRDNKGFSNQKDWEKEIKLNLTKADEDHILEVQDKADSDIRKLESDIEDLNLEISDIHWELTIKLEYYKESPIITNTENLVLSSGK